MYQLRIETLQQKKDTTIVEFTIPLRLYEAGT